MSSLLANVGRRWPWLLAALLCGGVACAGMLWWKMRPAPLPEPPSVALAGMDPPVAQTMENARAGVEKEPRSAAAWGTYGMVLGGYGMKAEAIRCFTVAEQLNPREPRWPYFRAVGLELTGADTEALAPLRQTVLLCPGDDPDMPRLRLANLLLRLGQEREAEEHYQELLAHHPGHPPALLGLALVAQARGSWAAARQHLQGCLSSPAVRKTAHQLLAEVERRLGHVQASRQAFQQASALPADLPWPDPFQQEIEQLKLDRHARTRHILQLRRNGHEQKADELLRALEQDYPGSAVYLEGRRLLDAGDLDGAAAAFRDAARQGPDFESAPYYLGIVQRRQKDYPAAAATFRRVLQLQPRHPAAHEQLGLCLQELGDSAGALDAFRSAALYLPQKAELQRRLGKLLLDTGHPEEARLHLRQALALQPDDAAARDLLDRLH